MALEPTQPAPTPMPLWLSVPIVLLCLFSGGWIIHWYVMTDPISHESTMLGDPIAQTNWGAPNPRPRVNGTNNARRYVRDHGNANYELRTEQARADVSTATGKPAFRIITYLSYQFVPDDVKSTIYAARSLVADTQRTTALNLTLPQIKQLRQLSTTITMAITPADREQLGTAVRAYVAANPAERPAMETKVLQALDQVAANSMAATRQQAVDRAKQINTIVTPQMWKQNTAMGGAK